MKPNGISAGTEVKTTQVIKLRGVLPVPAGARGIVCWSDWTRGLATVQFISRIVDDNVPLELLEKVDG